jgi:hypothetical protein
MKQVIQNKSFKACVISTGRSRRNIVAASIKPGSVKARIPAAPEASLENLGVSLLDLDGLRNRLLFYG